MQKIKVPSKRNIAEKCQLGVTNHHGQRKTCLCNKLSNHKNHRRKADESSMRDANRMPKGFSKWISAYHGGHFWCKESCAAFFSMLLSSHRFAHTQDNFLGTSGPFFLKDSGGRDTLWRICAAIDWIKSRKKRENTCKHCKTTAWYLEAAIGLHNFD